jgi:hypothetical protein
VSFAAEGGHACDAILADPALQKMRPRISCVCVCREEEERENSKEKVEKVK